MSRIGVYGGTFNPPHLGHRRLALEAKETAELDKIIVIPDNVPPHKQAETLVSGENRLELCRRTFCEDFFEFSGIELNREGPSYTYLTLQALKEQYPDDELFLIIGSDMLLMFDKWVNFRLILSMAKLCCMTREADVSSEELKAFASGTLGLSDDDVIICPAEPFEISSTGLRRMIACGQSIEGFVTTAAAEYILENELYI